MGCAPDLVLIRGLFASTTGDAAFDQAVVNENIGSLVTVPEVRTGHPFLDLSVKTGLALIDATFQGDHPKYGVGGCAETRHDGFPPTIIATVDALTSWGLSGRAVELFRYWLANFVRKDGTIRYYGPSLSEYGQLLHVSALLYERAGPKGWWTDGRQALARMAEHLLGLCAEAERAGDLIPGVPEADVSSGEPRHLSDPTHNEGNSYFHNNAWVARGLKRWANLLDCSGTSTSQPVPRIRRAADKLAERTLAAIERTWPADPEDWWLAPQVDPSPRPDCLTDGALASYTNYRYWPELLASGLLPTALADRVVEARLSGGGQFCGMTRFQDHLDDWPLADYLCVLWRLGRKHDFLLSLYGHVAYHQAEGHLTAYEQVSFPPGGQMLAPYCLPCQLVAARVVRRLGSSFGPLR